MEIDRTKEEITVQFGGYDQDKIKKVVGYCISSTEEFKMLYVNSVMAQIDIQESNKEIQNMIIEDLEAL